MKLSLNSDSRLTIHAHVTTLMSSTKMHLYLSHQSIHLAMLPMCLK